jgi:nitrogen fixation NifU-like protein
VDRQEAIENLLDHYQRPRNRGALDDADVTMPGGNPGCGDLVTIYLKIDQSGERIERVTFEGEGCTISQAASSILTEMVQGAPLSNVDAMDFNDMIDELGREVVSTRPRCATLALGTLKAAIAKYRRGQFEAGIAADAPVEDPTCTHEH